MKNLALVLVISAASSVAQAEIGTGFYLGAAVGANSTSTTSTLTNTNEDVQSIKDSGHTSGSFDIYTGYGVVNNCIYFGGEIGYIYANEKIKGNYSLTGLTGTLDEQSSFKYERKHLFNFALRAGYKHSPSTMSYIRLGLNYGKQKLTVFDANYFPGPAPITESYSRRRVTFVPGVGIETSLHKNIWLRAEYTYDLGKKINKTTNTVVARLTRVKSNNFKLGIAYKF